MQQASLPGQGNPARGEESALRRETMVECQIRPFDVHDKDLLARMLELPRENFLPRELWWLANSDAALHLNPAQPGGERRVLLPPFVLARLIQAAEAKPSDAVLDVAPGTGYSTAILAGLAGRAVAVESDSSLYKALRSNLDAVGLSKVETVLGPLHKGAPSHAPFDLILVNGAAEANLDSLFAQLKEGGRLLAFRPLSRSPGAHTGEAVRYEKIRGTIGLRPLFEASVPMLDAFRKSKEFVFA